MTQRDFNTTLVVDQTPEEVFQAINNVRGWWSETIEGGTTQFNDEFIYRHKDMHYSKQKIVELIPNKKVVWLVTDSRLTFIKDRTEWTGTKISFEIFVKDGKTLVSFNHLGLTSSLECFDDCSNGWSYYLKQSLLKLINTGKGQPDKKENKTITQS
jgi:hypothetical protein